MPRYTESNKYNATPRKVFDKHVDRMEVRRQRDREDHRADLKAIFHRIINLEQALQDLADHVAQHCLQIDEDRADPIGVSQEDTGKPDRG